MSLQDSNTTFSPVHYNHVSPREGVIRYLFKFVDVFHRHDGVIKCFYLQKFCEIFLLGWTLEDIIEVSVTSSLCRFSGGGGSSE